MFDDSPFYFAIEKPWGMPYADAAGLLALVEPVGVLLALFVAFGKPRGERGRRRTRRRSSTSRRLGAGFIAIELTLLQNLTLLLGHPIFTLSVLLFTLLATSGLGSSLSKRVPTVSACLTVAVARHGRRVRCCRTSCRCCCRSACAARIAIAIALIAPFGLLMGMPFPQGLRKTGRGPLPAPPFYWGLNGVMSVLGSVGTVVIALISGFQIAMLAGASCYLIAAFAAGTFAPAKS